MKAAFFDIDGTIYRDSLLKEHFKKLIKYELFNIQEYENRVKESFKKWDERMGDYDMYLMGMAETYVDAIRGLSLKYNDFVADQVMELKGSRVYTYTRDRIKWHKEQGHKVIFISGSPDFLVSRMAEKWEADDFCGSKYHVEEGKFSGEISPMWDSANKMKAINKFVEKYDLDLAGSYAYGDTMGDLSMMKLVGHPTAINPSKELIEVLREDESLKEKVDIIIERKDVIYKVDPSVEVL
ncbi:phosphoserine phosphatase [Propionigenium maris DSM 9537]|uniref:phosphoserine phosphatase n=1 Tax=Propionigenium maris DSM 9537 TaxID=1123000 RepID=A0A9W6GMB7_9FUSO|nr:HAD family hydrolase [Propionigenium maris]GLI56770.1 phosphoserine phosphatase [Propionigenium maris DSM 9537]